MYGVQLEFRRSGAMRTVFSTYCPTPAFPRLRLNNRPWNCEGGGGFCVGWHFPSVEVIQPHKSISLSPLPFSIILKRFDILDSLNSYTCRLFTDPRKRWSSLHHHGFPNCPSVCLLLSQTSHLNCRSHVLIDYRPSRLNHHRRVHGQ